MTDVMDKWGDLSGDDNHENPWNSDIIGNNGGDRYWVTKKLDLYAKWSSKLVGAKGIYVVYDSGDGYFSKNGNNAVTEYCDNYLYADNTNTYAIAASYPNDTDMCTSAAGSR